MSGLTRDGTAQDQTLMRERGQGKFRFPCSADHEQDWQPYPVDVQSECMHVLGRRTGSTPLKYYGGLLCPLIHAAETGVVAARVSRSASDRNNFCRHNMPW